MGLLFGLAFSVLSKSIVKTKQYNIQRNLALDLAYKTFGADKKDTIFILHGLLGSKRNWDSMSKSLRDEVNSFVVALDLRNHGESPHSENHSYMSLALDVAKLIENLKKENVNVIGHSMGGRTAMVLALSQPKKVRRLIVVDISPISTPGVLNNFFPRLIDVMKTVKFEPKDNVAECRAAAKYKLTKAKLVDDPAELGFILMNVGRRYDNKIGWMCNLDALKKHFDQISSFPTDMAGIKYLGPTLFIAGQQSNYVPPSDINGIRSYFPAAELMYVEGAGHNVHAESPDKFTELVVNFIKNT